MTTKTKIKDEAKLAKAVNEIKLYKLDIQEIEVEVKGTAPIIMNKFSAKMQAAIKSKQSGEGNVGREVRDPDAEYKSKLHVHPLGGYGFPAVGFKAAAVRAAKSIEGMSMQDARCAFHIHGVEVPDMIKIDSPEKMPSMREDMGRLKGTTAVIIYRGEFREWSAKLLVRFNARAISAEQVVNLINVAGFGVGVGDWRPGKSDSGQFGTFEVVFSSNTNGVKKKKKKNKNGKGK